MSIGLWKMVNLMQHALKRKDSIDIDRASMLIEGGNNRSKMIGDALFKVTGDLMNIQKKRCIC